MRKHKQLFNYRLNEFYNILQMFIRLHNLVKIFKGQMIEQINKLTIGFDTDEEIATIICWLKKQRLGKSY